jgi:hypothetical protein
MLAGDDAPCREAAPLAVAFDREVDRDARIASADEIGVEAVAEPIVCDRPLRCRERLGNHIAAEQARCGRVGRGRAEPVLPDFLQLQHRSEVTGGGLRGLRGSHPVHGAIVALGLARAGVDGRRVG